MKLMKNQKLKMIKLYLMKNNQKELMIKSIECYNILKIIEYKMMVVRK